MCLCASEVVHLSHSLLSVGYLGVSLIGVGR